MGSDIQKENSELPKKQQDQQKRQPSFEDNQLHGLPISDNSHTEIDESYLVESWNDDYEYSKHQSPRPPYFKKAAIKPRRDNKEHHASKGGSLSAE